MYKLHKTLILVLLLLSSMGCTLMGSKDKQLACQEVDWYEIGRQVGSLGLPPQVEQQENFRTCKSPQKNSFAALYKNGHQAGLAEFCTRDNGVTLGRTGQNYHATCPAEIEAGFLTGYVKGQRIFKLEKRNLNIDREITKISSQLKAQRVKSTQTATLENSLAILKIQKRQINSTLSNIERSL